MSTAVMVASQLTAPSLSSLRSGSTEPDDVEPVRLRIFYGGNFAQGVDGKWKYQGGEIHLESIPRKWRYADLMHRLAERTNGAVSLKYFEPSDEMDPDNLITVSDDDDLQEMMDEYLRALRLPGTPLRSFRLRAVLFPAVEHDLTSEELADAAAFFTHSGSEAALSKAGDARGRQPADAFRRSSLGSSGSSGERSGGEAAPLTDAQQLWHEGFDAGWRSGTTRRALQLDSAADSYGDGYDQDTGTTAADLYHNGGGGGWLDGAQEEEGAQHVMPEEAGMQQGLEGHGEGYELTAADAAWGQHSTAAARAAAARQHELVPFDGAQHLEAFSNQPYGTKEPYGIKDNMYYSNYNNGGGAVVPPQMEGPWGEDLVSKLAALAPCGVRPSFSGGSRTCSTPLGLGSARVTPRSSPRSSKYTDSRRAAAAWSGVNGRSPMAASTNAAGDPFGAIEQGREQSGVLLDKLGLPSHISAFGEGSSAAYRAPTGSAAAACLPDHLFSLDGSPYGGTGKAVTDLEPTVDGKYQAGTGQAVQLGGQYSKEAEAEWTAIAVANAGLAPFHPYQPPSTGRGPQTPAGSVVAAAAQLRQLSGDSGSSASLPITGVHRVLKEDLNILGPLGEGAFGDVSLAQSPIFGKVATKWLKPGKVERHTEAFWREAEMLAAVNHPNVLRFYGVVLASASDQSVVGIMTEYMRDGSLAAWLRQQREYLALSKRAALALDAVKGLAYLHAMHIVHFDLKPDNLLLDGDTVKVADFGLSKHKRLDFVSGVKDLRGTLPYMAPELVSEPDRVSEKADVWSLGMVLWELLTLEVPFAHLSPQQIIHGLMVGSLQPPVPDWCEDEWRSLMENCWVVNPTMRPSLRDVMSQLERVYDMAVANGL